MISFNYIKISKQHEQDIQVKFKRTSPPQFMVPGTLGPLLARWFTRSVWYQTAVNGRHFTP